MTANAHAEDPWPPRAAQLTEAEQDGILAATHHALREIVPWRVWGQERQGDGGTALADITFDDAERRRFLERKGEVELPSSLSRDDVEYRSKIDERNGTVAYCMEGPAECMWVAGHYAKEGDGHAVTLTAATFREMDYELESPMDNGLDEALGRARRNKAVIDLEALHGVATTPVRLRVTRSEVREAYEELDAMDQVGARHWASGTTPMAVLLANGVGGLSLPERGLEGKDALEALGRDFGAVAHRTIALDPAAAMDLVANRNVARYAGAFKAAVSAMEGRKLASEVAPPSRAATRTSHGR